jgi:hypothetical protein
MAETKQSIIDTASRAQARAQAFITNATGLGTSSFKDSALQLALELIKYGDYIKSTLLMDAATVVKPATTRTRKVDPKLLEGASEEEKAIVERTPPGA